jgi:hypothetical protein
MIADVPPFYVQFLKSLLARKRHERATGAIRQTAAPVAVKLLPKPDVIRLEQPATALRALPLPEEGHADVLSLPDRDHLRTVVPDYDHMDYGD